jgi:hypothetical protein
MQLNYSLSGHDLFLLVSFYGFLSDMVQKSDVYLITTLIHTIKQAY